MVLVETKMNVCTRSHPCGVPRVHPSSELHSADSGMFQTLRSLACAFHGGSGCTALSQPHTPQRGSLATTHRCTVDPAIHQHDKRWAGDHREELASYTTGKGSRKEDAQVCIRITCKLVIRTTPTRIPIPLPKHASHGPMYRTRYARMEYGRPYCTVCIEGVWPPTAPFMLRLSTSDMGDLRHPIGCFVWSSEDNEGLGGSGQLWAFHSFFDYVCGHPRSAFHQGFNRSFGKSRTLHEASVHIPA